MFVRVATPGAKKLDNRGSIVLTGYFDKQGFCGMGSVGAACSCTSLPDKCSYKQHLRSLLIYLIAERDNFAYTTPTQWAVYDR